MEIVEELKFEKMEDFLSAISYGGKLFKLFEDGTFVFRGQASEKYELIPSALRPKSKNFLIRSLYKEVYMMKLNIISYKTNI